VSVTRSAFARASLPPLAAALVAACGGGADQPATVAADTPAVRRVWTPEEARALRQERARADSIPPSAIPVPGPAAGEDSVAWAAEEKEKYDQRVQAMGSYADCMAKARTLDPAVRPQVEAGCRRLPSAPKP
jgi:hypothetical protein